MTVKELSEFLGKSEATIRRACKELHVKSENGKIKTFSKEEVEMIANKLFKKVPLSVKESIKITFPKDKGQPLSNEKVLPQNEQVNIIKSILDPILKQQNEFNLRLLQEIKDIKTDTKQIEFKQDYYSILGYMNYMNIDEARFSEMICYGKEASKISREMCKQIRRIPDERFGHVNSYHVDVLKKVFEM